MSTSYVIVPPTDNKSIATQTDLTAIRKKTNSVSPNSTSTKPVAFDIDKVHTGSSGSTNSDYAKYPEVVEYLASGESNIIKNVSTNIHQFKAHLLKLFVILI